MMISYVMMVYNEERYIVDAVESVLRQGEGIELIVIDDGSTDRTPKILSEQFKDNNVVRIVLSKHIGKNAAANLGVSMATGDWICLVAGDDLIVEGAKDRVSVAVNRIDASLQEVAVFSSMQMVSENPKYNGIRIPKSPHRVNRTGSYAYMSKRLVENMFPLPEDYPNEDTWTGLYYRYLLQEHIDIHDILALYRIHDTNSIAKDARFADYNEYYHARRIVIKPFLDRYKDSLSANQIDELNKELELEDLRYRGETRKIILSSTNSFIDKARLVVFSNKYLYAIKVFLNRFMLGH